MNPLESLALKPIRRELSDVCKKMIQLARGENWNKNKSAYFDSSPEYLLLANRRDKLAKELVTQWNRMTGERYDTDRKIASMAKKQSHRPHDRLDGTGHLQVVRPDQ